MDVTGDKQQNIKHAEQLIRTAHQRHQPKLIVLPELFNTKLNKQNIIDSAENIPNGETTNTLSKLAKELQVYLVGGSIAERDDKTKDNLYNTTTVFGPNGNMIAKFRKVHLLDVELENNVKLQASQIFKAGNDLTTFDMDGIMVGLGIGYDMSFCEMAALYRKQGADMLIFPANYPTELANNQWDTLNRSRAIDNQMFVLGVSQARNNDKQNLYVQHGQSMLVDFRGQILARCGDQEEIVFGKMNFDEQKLYRDQVQLFKQKRNDMYEIKNMRN